MHRKTGNSGKRLRRKTREIDISDSSEHIETYLRQRFWGLLHYSSNVDGLVGNWPRYIEERICVDECQRYVFDEVQRTRKVIAMLLAHHSVDFVHQPELRIKIIHNFKYAHCYLFPDAQRRERIKALRTRSL